MRLVLAELPAQLHGISLHTIDAVNRGLFAAFGGRQSTTARKEIQSDTEQGFAALAADAVDIGDEHASCARRPYGNTRYAPTPVISLPRAPRSG